MIAAVLLVLGGVHAGIIGHTDHHAGVDPGIGNGKQRVAATLTPTCFITQALRLPASAAPKATSMATFSLGAHSQ